MFTFGCSDPCDDISCGPGTCDDGTCICPTGYEGTSCETESRTKYYNKYVKESIECDDGFNSTFEWFEISEGTGAISNIKFDFSSDGTKYSEEGTIIKGKLNVSGEIGGFELKIKGSFSDNDKKFTGTIAIPGFLNCDAILTAN